MMEKYDKLIRAFHLTWDAFPGTARVISVMLQECEQK